MAWFYTHALMQTRSEYTDHPKEPRARGTAWITGPGQVPSWDCRKAWGCQPTCPRPPLALTRRKEGTRRSLPTSVLSLVLAGAVGLALSQARDSPQPTLLDSRWAHTLGGASLFNLPKQMPELRCGQKRKGGHALAPADSSPHSQQQVPNVPQV